MKKIILLILIGCLSVLLFTGPVFAVTYYYKSAGVNTNWSNGANWCDATNGGGTCGTAPTASIDAVLDSSSGNINIDTTTCVAKTLTSTGYTGVLTFTSGMTLSVSGTVTLAATHTIDGTGTLKLNAAGNLTTGGLAIPNLTLSASAATALQDDLAVTGTLFNQGGTNTAFTGAYDISCATLTFGGVYTLAIAADRTLTVSTAINMAASSFLVPVLKAGSGHAHLIYDGAVANCKVAGATFTDIVYSGTTVTKLYDWYGTVSGATTGIYVVTSASFPAAGNVLSSATYDGTNAGTYHEATTAEVQSGVTFGAASALTGTYVGGGGSASAW